MKYAIISDVHSNLEALETACAEIKKRKPDGVVCLGDVVGYGANPSECLEMVKGLAPVIIMGNHDQAVEDLALREWFHPWAKEAIEWTARQLNANDKKFIRSFLPLRVDRKANVTLTHGSPDEPENYRYIFSADDARSSFQHLETQFCFFGHTHIPTLVSDPEGEVCYLPAGVYHLGKKIRYLINPGSVGQPRDRNPQLSFGLFDSLERTFEVVRLDYDNEKTARKIRKAGLPSYLADRLL